LPNNIFKDTLFRFNVGFLSARIGEWLFTVALNWVIFVQTESPLLLAAINACRLLPNLVLSIPAGHLADLYCRRRLNIANNVGNAVLTLGVGLTLLFKLPFTVCAVLVVLRAVTTATEGPFRNAYLCSAFQGDKLKSVVAQNASVMNLGRIIGPVAGGALLATAGSFVTFVLAALLTAFYGWALTLIPTFHRDGPGKKKSRPSFSFKETFARHPELGKLVKLAIPVMFFGFPFTSMLPLVTESVLHLGSEEFGALLAVSAAGALLASSKLSFRPDNSNWLSTRLYAAAFGVSLLGLAAAGDFYTAAVVLFAVGYFGQAYRTSSRMLFQDVIPKEEAGKLLGLALMDRGMIPLGGLLIGGMAEFCDPRIAVATMGVGCLMSVSLFFPLFKFRRYFSLAGIGIATTVALVLSGCQPQSPKTTGTPTGPTLEVTHAWGATQVPKEPDRIVVLDLPFLDAFSALDQVVVGFAGTSDKEIPKYLADRIPGKLTPMFVGERKQPNLEVILSLNPDLIVANPDRHKMIRPQLESIAPTIALTDDSLGQIEEATRLFARITGKEEKADLVEQNITEAVKKAQSIQNGQPSVLVVGAFEDEFSTWTKGSFIGSLFQKVGAEYAFDGPPSASESQTEVAKITVEGLAELDPDYLFVYGDPSRWEENPLYTQISAVESGRSLNVDRDLWSRARGPIAAQKILESYVDFLESQQEVAAQPPGR